MVVAISSFAARPPSFRDGRVRYLLGHDLFRLFAQKFPNVNPEFNSCFIYTDKHRAALGDTSPSNGEMTYRTTSAAFVSWYTQCLSTLIGADLRQAAKLPDGLKRFSGPVTIEDPTVVWSALTEGQRTQIIQHQIRSLVGPGILKDEAALIQKIHAALSAPDLGYLAALEKMIYLIAMQEEFFTY